MKRIIIICEGQTERDFCKEVLAPYLWQYEIDLQAPRIKVSGGGIVKWADLKKEIENYLKQSETVFVSTLIDYYGLYEKYHFPKWKEGTQISEVNERISLLEEAMREEIAGLFLIYNFMSLRHYSLMIYKYFISKYLRKIW